MSRASKDDDDDDNRTYLVLRVARGVASLHGGFWFCEALGRLRMAVPQEIPVLVVTRIRLFPYSLLRGTEQPGREKSS